MALPEIRSYAHLLVRLLIAAAAFVAMLLAGVSLFRPEAAEKPIEYSDEVLAATDAHRKTSFDLNSPPVIWRKVDYSKGRRAAWWPKGESPILAQLVGEGKLPPVEERVGPEPAVLEGWEGNGRYGGTWVRVGKARGDMGMINSRLGVTLVRWSPMGYPIVPHVAKSWDVNEDKTEWTFHLRKGMRWSDGHSFTAEDILYWWRDLERFGLKRPDFMMVRGESGQIIAVDAYTVRFIFKEPNTVLLELLSGYPPFALPAHYLRPYHPQLGDDALIEATMRAKNIPTRRGLYAYLQQWANPEMPRLSPWLYRTYSPGAPQFFVRNPYYFAVDPAGNQLPYVDRVMFEVRSSKIIPSFATSGALTMQSRYIQFADYTMLMSERARGGYEVYHWYMAGRSIWAIFPNLNRIVEPGRPATRWKARLLRNKRFRRALSLAINRREIIEAEYSNVGEPAQISPGRASPFFYEKLHNAYTEYDPRRSNRILDELGLDERDSEGLRTFPDGSRMTFYLDVSGHTGLGPAQFVKEDWADVGVRLIFRLRADAFFEVEKRTRRMDFVVLSGANEFIPLAEPRSFVPVVSGKHGIQAEAYALWYEYGGLYGRNIPEEVAAEAPSKGGPIREAMKLLELVRQTTQEEEQRRLMNKIFDIDAEQIFSINIATPPPDLVIVQNGFRNVPLTAVTGGAFKSPSNAGIETYYFERPWDSAGATEKMRQELVEITPLPNAIDEQTLEPSRGGYSVGRLIRHLVLGIAVVGVLLAAVRHPYIGRRLLILIPTLLIISVFAFTIIQLPPGDFIQAKILEAKMTGDQTAIDQVMQLRELFPFEEPLPVQYALWLGLKWFFTFEEKDGGLLQGHLGRSMESLQTVNETVGDRVLLTFLISLGTILFTWVTAIPIGIYSAVKQYSFGDYCFTFLGFVGMCVPNFLLALILMYLGKEYFGIAASGLFSPEYAALPEWTMSKVFDLLQHIWVPVVVLGVGGTAGMIRVMRGNLLDELRKPYVVAARAKGVRPLKLLVKYPVRLALNPFISGIGAIFPKLVSGGAIVAMVLSLPTVGPLMLAALMTEDMYLAGSMLMILSLMGVLGTLVSDLLLLWLDPRIRYEGGGAR